MTSRIVSYLLDLNFKNPIDREQLTAILIENGFKQKFEKNGFLISEGNHAKNPPYRNMQRSVHTSKYSLISEYCSVHPFNGELGTKISINYNFGTLAGDLKNIIRELNLIFEILKKKLHHQSTDIHSCSLEVAVSVKNKKDPLQTLDNLDSVGDIQLFKDMEMVKWNHAVYLYSRDLDITKESVDSCIIEDMKKKNIAPKNTTQKNRWNKFVLIPHSNEYVIVMNYSSSDIDVVVQTFGNVNELASELINEVEK